MSKITIKFLIGNTASDVPLPLQSIKLYGTFRLSHTCYIHPTPKGTSEYKVPLHLVVHGPVEYVSRRYHQVPPCQLLQAVQVNQKRFYSHNTLVFMRVGLKQQRQVAAHPSDMGIHRKVGQSATVLLDRTVSYKFSFG